MLVFKLIKVLFNGAVFFITVGLIVIISSAMFSALMDVEMEDGSTFKEMIVKSGSEIKEAYAPVFEGVDVKAVLKKDAKELEQLGRKTISKTKKKVEPIINEYSPIVEEKINELDKIIDEHKK